jgi:hypothetical protein
LINDSEEPFPRPNHLKEQREFTQTPAAGRERRMAKNMPHAGHDKHMCYLVNVRTPINELKKLAKDAKYICKNCARVSSNIKNLCNPVKL